MIISFHTGELRDACSTLKDAEARLGALDAQALIGALADLEALETAADLLSFFGQDANLVADNVIELSIGAHHRAMLVVVGNRHGRVADGGPDWATVRRMKLMDPIKWR